MCCSILPRQGSFSEQPSLQCMLANLLPAELDTATLHP